MGEVEKTYFPDAVHLCGTVQQREGAYPRPSANARQGGGKNPEIPRRPRHFLPAWACRQCRRRETKGGKECGLETTFVFQVCGGVFWGFFGGVFFGCAGSLGLCCCAGFL